MSVKKDLLAEIDRKIARKKEMAARAVLNNSIHAFVGSYIDTIEEHRKLAESRSDWSTLEYIARDRLKGQIQSFDNHCDLEVSWDHPDDEYPRVNGVLIKWSKEYQAKHNVDPQLFVDIMTLVLKD